MENGRGTGRHRYIKKGSKNVNQTFLQYYVKRTIPASGLTTLAGSFEHLDKNRARTGNHLFLRISIPYPKMKISQRKFC